jgi:signal transduction histidine kinase
MARIQGLVTDDANRRALASVVDQRHTPITDSELRDADLYLVDDGSLREYRDALEAHKREQAPVFCPVVLIRRSQTPVSIELPTPDPDDDVQLIDEVVDAPVEKPELFRRIGNLVVRREQTVDLDEKNERLEQLSKTLRHEVRNPLQILSGYLEIAEQRGDPAYFEKCYAAIDRMQRLFDETLVIVDGGEIETSEAPVDLAQLCEQSWKIIDEPDASVEVTAAQQIVADETRLRQLLENLFRNAVDHGGSAVTVEVGDLESGFYVEDDGPGVPPADRDAVFEDGYTTRGAGTGLGLAVVAGVADGHDWDVRVTDGALGGA